MRTFGLAALPSCVTVAAAVKHTARIARKSHVTAPLTAYVTTILERVEVPTQG